MSNVDVIFIGIRIKKNGFFQFLRRSQADLGTPLQSLFSRGIYSMAAPSDKMSSNEISYDEDLDFLANLAPAELVEVHKLRIETATKQRQIGHLELSNASKFNA